jgi:hypothetical protein
VLQEASILEIQVTVYHQEYLGSLPRDLTDQWISGDICWIRWYIIYLFISENHFFVCCFVLPVSHSVNTFASESRFTHLLVLCPEYYPPMKRSWGNYRGLPMCTVWAEKVKLSQYQYFGFPCQSSFHQLLHNHPHLSPGACTIGQKWPQYLVDLIPLH